MQNDDNRLLFDAIRWFMLTLNVGHFNIKGKLLRSIFNLQNI